MKRAKIIEMIDTGRIPAGSDLNEVKQLSRKYPFCSAFRVLLAMASKETDDLELREAINLAAVYVPDRSKLYDLIIRDGLRSRLDEESRTDEPNTELPEESSAKREPSQTEGATPPVEAERDMEVGASEESSDEEVIKTDLLEDQIMAEAVMHLGELEMEGLPDDESPADDPPKPTENGPSDEQARTFGGWLLDLDKSGKTRPEREIIDRFISEDRQITPAKKAFFSPTQMGKMSLMEDDTFVTETLAKIYERQGDYKKAARAYKNLSLKYPEKRVYFADLQKKAEEKI